MKTKKPMSLPEVKKSDPNLLLVSVAMGYGHMRAAHALSEYLGLEILHADRSPLADEHEAGQWRRIRSMYELISRLSQTSRFARPLGSLLEIVTDIPDLYAVQNLSAPTLGVHLQELLIQRFGIGRGLVHRLQTRPGILLTTYFTPALVADRAGIEGNFCVVTDADINRIWAPLDPARSQIQYLVPSLRALRRLKAFGVPKEHLHHTGYPLPHGLLGGTSLERLRGNLAKRLVRLDPNGVFKDQFQNEIDHFLGPLPVDSENKPPHLVFAVGGAGAQVDMVRVFLPDLRRMLGASKLRLTLVAGVRQEVAACFNEWIEQCGLKHRVGDNLEVVVEDTLERYFMRFNLLLKDADILWTKPSELSFFCALGLPLVFANPVGEHERCNRRWAIEHGAGLKQGNPRYASGWLGDWLQDGTLAQAAWSGYMRMPKFGLYQIAQLLGKELADEPDQSVSSRAS